MKRWHINFMAMSIICLVVFIPALVGAGPDTPPPVGTPLVREGDFAVSLADALELGAGEDEIAAESRLGELGISPQNGWIADYPLTPDIAGELQQSLIAAADGSRLPMSRDDALQIFYDVSMELGLSVVPYADESIRQSSSEDYPAPATVNNYYYNYGPPVVTYYEPPRDYVYLYAWVPFPFWSWGFWFPGYYVLHDFHKTVVIDSRVVYVSNHYRDTRYKRVYIVDPVKRYHHSGTVYGIGAQRHDTVVYKGSPKVARQALDINLRRDGLMRAHTTLPSGRNAPVVRPVTPKNKPAPMIRPVNTPVQVKKNDNYKKEPVGPRRLENERTAQAGRTAPVQTDRAERQARPMMKSIENKPQSVRAPMQVEQKNARPQSAYTNASRTARPHAAVNQAPPSRDNRAPARIQPQQRNEGGSGRGQDRATQAPAKAQGKTQSPAKGGDKKEAPPQVR